MNRRISKILGILLFAFVLLMPVIISPAHADAAATTSLTIKKLAVDKTTVLSEKTVTYQELVAGELSDGTDIAILGDGTTHYYHQGPVFLNDTDPTTQATLRWNAAEDIATTYKDKGAVKGTNLKDLCDLVGGMGSDDTVKIKSNDGWNRTFAYKNVYQYSSKEGPMVICWYKDGNYPDSGYNAGMQLVWFADTSTNPSGLHIFGNWDWHEAADEDYWYYFPDADGDHPSADGLSGKYVSEITIYSDDPVPSAPVAAFSADKTSGGISLAVAFTDSSTGTPTSWAWDFNNDGTTDSTLQNPTYTYATAGDYTVTLTATNAAGSDDEVKTAYIKAGVADFPLQLIGATTVSLTKADLAAMMAQEASNTYTTTGDNNVFEGVPLYKLIALVDDGDPTTLNTSLLDTYNINFTGYNQNGTDFVKTATAGSWSTLFTAGINNNKDIFVATKVELNGTSEFIDLPAVNPANGIKNWRPAILTGGNIATGGSNRVGGLYKIELTGLTASPVAAFSASATSGTAPLSVTFTDQSTGSPTSWAWDFDNDGIVDSEVQNPSYDFATVGTYTVKLTVTNAAGSDYETKTNYITVNEESTTTELYNGTVDLAPDTTFTVTSYNGSTTDPVYTERTVSSTTPLGALQAAATEGNFTYLTNDKKWTDTPDNKVLLLDDIGTYTFNNPGKWYAYVNDVYKDGYNNKANALNLISLSDGDKVEFYYASGISTDKSISTVKAAATVAVKTVVNIVSIDILYNGTVDLDPHGTFDVTAYNSSNAYKVSQNTPMGALNAAATSGGFTYEVTDKKMIQKGIFLLDNLYKNSSQYKYSSAEGIVSSWYGYIGRDDDKNGTYTYTYLDWYSSTDLAINKYELEDGDKVEYYYATSPSATDYATVKAAATAAVKTVVNIETVDWNLEMLGEIGYTVTQEEFEEALACDTSDHYVTWTDSDGKVWSGIPLWFLLGTIDDEEASSHWTFNNDLAAEGYTVKITDEDGNSITLNSADVAGSDDYLIANVYDGNALDTAYPLRLVGNGVATDGVLGDNSIGNIVKIEIPDFETAEAAEGSYNLTVKGVVSDVISKEEIDDALSCTYHNHKATWTNGDNTWSGMPLWCLAAWVDDTQPHDYDYNQAVAGYTITLIDDEGNSIEIDSNDTANSNDYIIANKLNGVALTGTDWPLRLVGEGVSTENSIGNIVEIDLSDFQTIEDIPELHIVKYGADGTTIVDEETITYEDMMEDYAIYGDGETVYKYEGVTFNPDNVWEYADGVEPSYKIENAVKGTLIKDLVELVGGMGEGTDVILSASDGYETVLPYENIYVTDKDIQDIQGDAVLAWWGDGEYVPYYEDGMRVFFLAPDQVYSEMDMYNSLDIAYWHYYFSDNVCYPSCAGTSTKNIVEIEVYTVPPTDWSLNADGTDLEGGTQYNISRRYFESAVSCQLGSNHAETYTDSDSNVWKGLPLYFLAGYVDDENRHSEGAFNDELAASGYNVVLTDKEGNSVTIDSKDMMNSRDYVIANTENGARLDDDDANWPLKLVGSAVSEENSLGNIVSIKLKTYATVTSVSLNKEKTNIDPGKSETLIATVSPDTASDKTVTWSSSNSKIATVSNKGVVKGIKSGVAMITVTTNDGSLTATCEVTVNQPVTKVTLNKTATVNAGSTITLTPTITPTNATDKSVTWSSNNESVATVNSSGVVTGVANGTATITVTTTSGSKTATCKVTVNVPATSVDLSDDEVTIDAGKSVKLTATVSPADATVKTVTWSSSDPKIATVNSGGVVKGIKASKDPVTITATTTDGGFEATCEVTVNQPVTKVTLNKTATVNAGNTITLTPTITPATATDKSVTWDSSDDLIATVSAGGVVTGVSKGTATITVTTTSGGKTATCKVTVNVPVESVDFDDDNLNTVDAGKSITLKATVTPDTATVKTLTWTSSDKSIATVSSKGVVKGIKAGEVTITATSVSDGTCFDTCTITVNQPVTSVTLDKKTLSLAVSGTYTLTATIKPANATDQDITWSSSDEDVVTVVNGVVTAVGVGKATITVETDNGKKATCKVTVK